MRWWVAVAAACGLGLAAGMAGAVERFHACAYSPQYSPAEERFLASHYDVLVMDGKTRPASLRAINPRVKVLAYKALVCVTKGDEDWGAADPHDDWFIHDPATGLRLQSTDGYPWYLMDPAGGWRERFAQAAAGWQRAGFDGVFGDNGFFALPGSWLVTVTAQPAQTIGDGRTVRTVGGLGIYGVQGVYDNPAGTGHNYYASQHDDTITLDRAPGPVGTTVYLTYLANAYRFREPAVVEGGKVTVRSRADWVYGVYDSPELTGQSRYTGHGNDLWANEGDRCTITLGRPPAAGTRVWVKYRAQMAPAAKAASWQQDLLGLFRAVKQAAGPSFQLIYNGIVRRGLDEPYLAQADGGMMEQFITVSGDSPLYYDGYGRWLEEVTRVEQMVTKHPGKLCLVQSGVSKDEQYPEKLKNHWALFCFASYLLCRGGSTTFNFTKTGYTGLDWYPYWALEYGEPTGPRQPVQLAADLKGQGVWQRDFTKCRVIVNPTGGQAFTPTPADVTVTVPLGGPYWRLQADGTLAAEPIESVELPARTGVVLFRAGTPPVPER